MRRAMSTLVYARRERLHPGLLDQLVAGGAEAIEIFAARGHFNYSDRQHVREIGNWFRSTGIAFHSMHAPMHADDEWGRSGASPLNIAAVEKRGPGFLIANIATVVLLIGALYGIISRLAHGG